MNALKCVQAAWFCVMLRKYLPSNYATAQTELTGMMTANRVEIGIYRCYLTLIVLASNASFDTRGQTAEPTCQKSDPAAVASIDVVDTTSCNPTVATIR